MKRILLKFYLDVNLGDDVMIAMLLRRFPEHQFFIYTKSTLNYGIFEQYPNLFLLRRGYLKELCGKTKYDAYLVLGGSVLDYNRWIGLLYQIKEIILCVCARIKGVKTMVIGANTTQFPDRWYAFLYRFVFFLRIRLLHLITVRDRFSYRRISKYGEGKTHCFPDIVFGYGGQKDAGTDGPAHAPSGQVLGISVFFHSGSSRREASVYRPFAQAADLFLARGGEKVLLTAFDTGRSNDSYAVLQVYRMIAEKDRVELVFYNGDIAAFLQKLHTCSRFICVRFHALVLALMAQIPFMPVIYANKCRNLLDDLGYTGPAPNLLDLPAADPAQLLRMDPFLLGDEALKEAAEKSRGHFDVLEAYLNGL
ncbi:MAG TPA: polysaccharide pyruvyl transferase family protein [Feifaniaceae bacterium]|nr:polysaccharide pyruvyl transferase family protein [Feifaniaceae bacterium]